MDIKKKSVIRPGLECKPLRTIKDIQAFIAEPPVWRTLCQGFQDHSRHCVKNSDLCRDFEHITLEKTQNFCHYSHNAATAPRHLRGHLPRTLVCHDMANGYHDDSFIEGTSNHHAYTFYNWAGIDIFCYFSHNLITIPPVGWINVAHAHGVKVIGTIITEWAEGASFWNRVLNSPTETTNIISALVTIAKTLKFEGWLLNVENKITKPTKLLEFVRSLHEMLHQEVPHAILIWYDSVTTKGDLVWQNKLDDKNRAFFDACDGIFTNYSWSEDDVRESVVAAGSRVADLYIGIDVWGRHFYGGGMFNTQKAVRFAHKQGCSLAIFAPAWTHEAMKPDILHDPDLILNSDDLDWTQRFFLRDRALWDSLWPYFNTKLPCNLPFKTSFCRGHGEKRWMYGELLSHGPWFNLRHQQYQPNSAHGSHCYVLSTNELISKISTKPRSDAHSLVHLRDSLTELATKDPVTGRRRSILKRRSTEESDSIRLEDPPSRPSLSTRIVDWIGNALHLEIGLFSRRRRRQTRSRKPKRNTSLVEMEMPVRIRLGTSHRPEKTRLTVAHIAEELECFEVYFADSFTGGSCLKLNPSDHSSEAHRRFRLLQCDFQLEDTVYVCMVTKTLPDHDTQYLVLELLTHDHDEVERRVRLVARYMQSGPHVEQTTQKQMILYPLLPDDPEFKIMQVYLLLHEPGFYVPLDNAFGWKIFYFKVRLPWHRLVSVNAQTHHSTGPILLGQLGLAAWNPAAAAPVLAGSSQPVNMSTIRMAMARTEMSRLNMSRMSFSQHTLYRSRSSSYIQWSRAVAERRASLQTHASTALKSLSKENTGFKPTDVKGLSVASPILPSTILVNPLRRELKEEKASELPKQSSVLTDHVSIEDRSEVEDSVQQNIPFIPISDLSASIPLDSGAELDKHNQNGSDRNDEDRKKTSFRSSISHFIDMMLEKVGRSGVKPDNAEKTKPSLFETDRIDNSDLSEQVQNGVERDGTKSPTPLSTEILGPGISPRPQFRFIEMKLNDYFDKVEQENKQQKESLSPPSSSFREKVSAEGRSKAKLDGANKSGIELSTKQQHKAGQNELFIQKPVQIQDFKQENKEETKTISSLTSSGRIDYAGLSEKERSEVDRDDEQNEPFISKPAKSQEETSGGSLNSGAELPNSNSKLTMSFMSLVQNNNAEKEQSKVARDDLRENEPPNSKHAATFPATPLTNRAEMKQNAPEPGYAKRTNSSIKSSFIRFKDIWLKKVRRSDVRQMEDTMPTPSTLAVKIEKAKLSENERNERPSILKLAQLEAKPSSPLNSRAELTQNESERGDENQKNTSIMNVGSLVRLDNDLLEEEVERLSQEKDTQTEDEVNLSASSTTSSIEAVVPLRIPPRSPSSLIQIKSSEDSRVKRKVEKEKPENEGQKVSLIESSMPFHESTNAKERNEVRWDGTHEVESEQNEQFIPKPVQSSSAQLNSAVKLSKVRASGSERGNEKRRNSSIKSRSLLRFKDLSLEEEINIDKEEDRAENDTQTEYSPLSSNETVVPRSPFSLIEIKSSENISRVERKDEEPLEPLIPPCIRDIVSAEIQSVAKWDSAGGKDSGLGRSNEEQMESFIKFGNQLRFRNVSLNEERKSNFEQDNAEYSTQTESSTSSSIASVETATLPFILPRSPFCLIEDAELRGSLIPLRNSGVECEETEHTQTRDSVHLAFRLSEDLRIVELEDDVQKEILISSAIELRDCGIAWDNESPIFGQLVFRTSEAVGLMLDDNNHNEPFGISCSDNKKDSPSEEGQSDMETEHLSDDELPASTQLVFRTSGQFEKSDGANGNERPSSLGEHTDKPSGVVEGETEQVDGPHINTSGNQRSATVPYVFRTLEQLKVKSESSAFCGIVQDVTDSVLDSFHFVMSDTSSSASVQLVFRTSEPLGDDSESSLFCAVELSEREIEIGGSANEPASVQLLQVQSDDAESDPILTCSEQCKEGRLE